MNINDLKPKFKPLEDEDRMPFGKFKDERMIDIPASYFLFLWNNGMESETGGVADYIRNNLDRLEDEDLGEREERDS